jgi:hypothetical protein
MELQEKLDFDTAYAKSILWVKDNLEEFNLLARAGSNEA